MRAGGDRRLHSQTARDSEDSKSRASSLSSSSLINADMHVSHRLGRDVSEMRDIVSGLPKRFR